MTRAGNKEAMMTLVGEFQEQGKAIIWQDEGQMTCETVSGGHSFKFVLCS